MKGFNAEVAENERRGRRGIDPNLRALSVPSALSALKGLGVDE